MELATFVPLWLAVLLRLAGTELSEIFGGFWYNVLEQFHLDPSKLFA